MWLAPFHNQLLLPHQIFDEIATLSILQIITKVEKLSLQTDIL